MAENVLGPDPTIQQFDDGSSIKRFDDGSVLVTDSEGGVAGIPAGAEPNSITPATVNVRSLRSSGVENDLRIRIRVPDLYLKKSTAGIYGELYNLKGIIFPYTPQISYDVRAEYSSPQLLHANFPQHFYTRSTLGTIQIQGRITVQNEKDAGVYIATIHLLKSLTKMRTANDTVAGSPPPICRLQGYGDYMLNNVPVVITNYRVDLPENVDYFTMGKEQENNIYGKNTVPTISQLTLNCMVMYSRREIQEFSVTDWLTKTKGTDFRNKGFI